MSYNPQLYTLEVDTYSVRGHVWDRVKFARIPLDNIGARVQSEIDLLEAGDSVVIDISPTESG